MSRGMRTKDITYATGGAAAADLVAAEYVVLAPGARALIPTTLNGEDLEMADNQVGLVLSRSGLAYKHGVSVLNAPGVIDPDYKGTIGVILHNSSTEEFTVESGDRIAQIMLTNFTRIWGAKVEVKVRGAGGYGSTGK